MPRRPKTPAAIVSCSIVLMVAALAPLMAGAPRAAGAEVADTDLKQFENAYRAVLAEYVRKPEKSQLVEAAIRGMLASLDSQSSYIGQQEFRALQSSHGRLGSPGIDMIVENGVVRIVAPIEDSPAFKAGLLSNDIITHIDQESVEGLTINQAYNRLRGPLQTSVRLRISRKGLAESIDLTLQREWLKLVPIRSRIESGDVAYIRVPSFNELTLDALKTAIDKLRTEIGNETLTGYIIDLRRNTGGLRDQAMAVADAFLDDGEIVSTRGRAPDATQTFLAKPGDLAQGKPIVVLVNGGTASQAEVVAGALQDRRRATLIGTHTFGSGAVFSIVPLEGQGVLRLITGSYYTPSGRSIQARGLKPDLEVLQEGPDAPMRGEAVGERGSSSYFPADPTRDRQLIAAVDFLRSGQPNTAHTKKPTNAN